MPCRGVQQRNTRNHNATFVAKQLANRLRTEPEMKRMLSTNRILPNGSLKQKCVRRLFAGWIRTFGGKGRVFTLKLALQVCRKLRKKFSMDPMVAASESKRMLSMLQVARKRKLDHKAKPALDAMVVNPDELETQPMFQQAGLYM